MSGFFSKYAVVLIVLLLIRIVLSIVIGNFAKKKGKSFALYFILTLLFSAIVSILILLISVSMSNNNRVEYEPKSSNADEIKKYKTLLDSGAITQEEYEEKKKQLLEM